MPDPRPDPRLPARRRRTASASGALGRALRRSRASIAIYAGVALLLFVVTVAIPAAGVFDVPDFSVPETTREATVVAVEEVGRQQTPQGETVTQRVGVNVDGRLVVFDRQVTEGAIGSFLAEAGDRVLLTEHETPAGTSYYIADRSRTAPLWTLALLFAVLVVAIGGWRGGWSLLGLAASFLVILRFIIPGILSGWDPLLVSITGALVIMSTTLVLSHGVNRKTAVALGGTAAALAVTGLLAVISVAATRLSGVATDDAATLQVLAGGQIDPRGLLLGGILIGALGVLDDVTMTQSSTVFELRRANAALRAWDLFQRGMHVGRDHIAATVNTLVLAYAGTALPLLIIIAAQTEAPGILISRDLLATEVVRTLVGSVGIVAAVPLTTGLAAVVARRAPAGPPAGGARAGEPAAGPPDGGSEAEAVAARGEWA